jgi:hypothetical protein
MELHTCYVDCKDFGLAERILAQVFRLENVLTTLQNLSRES